MNPRALLFTLVLPASVPVTLAAQVGHPPDQSPFRDIGLAMRITPFGGWYSASRDAAGVLPRSGPLVGLRWDMHVGGPGELTVRLAMVPTDRDVIDPDQPAGDRLVESRKLTLGFGDVGISFHLTGNKSWHRIVPLVHAGLGLASDFNGADIGGFKHGSEFSLMYGAGVRYVTGRRFEFRADVGSYFYQLEYPSSYYALGADGTSVLTPATPRADWRNNWTFSIGAAFTPFR
jgi:hypothetical protein